MKITFRASEELFDVGDVVFWPNANKDTSISLRLYKVEDFNPHRSQFTAKRLNKVRSLWYWWRHLKGTEPKAGWPGK
jgi:hypothetical protein